MEKIKLTIGALKTIGSMIDDNGKLSKEETDRLEAKIKERISIWLLVKYPYICVIVANLLHPVKCIKSIIESCKEG